MSTLTQEMVEEAAVMAIKQGRNSDMPASDIINNPTDNEIVNKAAQVFQDNLPRVKAVAKNMKAGAIGRVFNAVMEFPLGDHYPKFRSDIENQLFITSMALLQAKTVMVQAIMLEQKQKEAAANAAINEAAAAVASSGDSAESAEANTNSTEEVANG